MYISYSQQKKTIQGDQLIDTHNLNKIYWILIVVRKQMDKLRVGAWAFRNRGK